MGVEREAGAGRERVERESGNPPKGSASPGGCGRPGPPVLASRKRGWRSWLLNIDVKIAQTMSVYQFSH